MYQVRASIRWALVVAALTLEVFWKAVCFWPIFQAQAAFYQKLTQEVLQGACSPESGNVRQLAVCRLYNHLRNPWVGIRWILVAELVFQGIIALLCWHIYHRRGLRMVRSIDLMIACWAAVQLFLTLRLQKTYQEIHFLFADEYGLDASSLPVRFATFWHPMLLSGILILFILMPAVAPLPPPDRPNIVVSSPIYRGSS
jgi:hypothetical protein